MIAGVSIYEILIVSTIVFFIGVYGFLTRKNLISVLLSVELILNSVAINFVIFNKYLYPGHVQGLFFSLFLIAVAAAEVAIAIAIIIDLYRLVKSVNVDDTTEMKY
jgi:NADH-quinone oxidoreductase subunit K